MLVPPLPHDFIVWERRKEVAIFVSQKPHERTRAGARDTYRNFLDIRALRLPRYTHM